MIMVIRGANEGQGKELTCRVSYVNNVGDSHLSFFFFFFDTFICLFLKRDNWLVDRYRPVIWQDHKVWFKPTKRQQVGHSSFCRGGGEEAVELKVKSLQSQCPFWVYDYDINSSHDLTIQCPGTQGDCHCRSDEITYYCIPFTNIC